MITIKEYNFNNNISNKLKEVKHGTNWPVVYIMHNSKEAYIGETTDISIRSNQHLAKEIRKELGITQERLAQKLNVSRPLVTHYEKGIRLVRTADLKEICETFGYSADWCVGKRGVCIRYKPVKKIEAKEVKKLISN